MLAEVQEKDDEPFDQKMKRLTAQVLKQEADARWLDEAIWKNLEELGYDN